MLFERLAEATSVGFISRPDFARQVSALLFGKSHNANLGHCGRQVRGHVESTYRNLLLAGESKNQGVQTIIVPPALVILRRPEELLFRGSSGDVIVHLWLEGLLKIFHSNRQTGI